MLSGRPREAELEVSVFGPGVGEAIVLHLGLNRWVVVDSCRTPEVGCVPLAYLRSLGVDVAESVTDVIATHAHSDHIRGIAELISSAENARFSVPACASTEEFITLLNLDAELVDFRPRVFRELDDAYTTVQQRRQVPQRCGVGREIRHFQAEGGLPEISLHAVSPSDQDLDASLADLVQLIQGIERQTVQASTRDPNHFAMAIWLTAGPVDALLGSDVLTGDSQLRGWDAVVDRYRGRFCATLLKVPHHGSHTGHHDDLWSDLVSEVPVAVVTPYRPSQLPTTTDLNRIGSLTSKMYLTARAPTPNRQQKNTAAALRGSASNVRWIGGRMGHVRARFNLAADDPSWQVNTDGVATEVR
jgi:beta-lactamase superfamily II metal-dependent hydrolase